MRGRKASGVLASRKARGQGHLSYKRAETRDAPDDPSAALLFPGAQDAADEDGLAGVVGAVIRDEQGFS